VTVRPEVTPAKPPPNASIEQLRAAAATCTACELYENATQTVFSAGSLTARIALVGEQPGDQEDRQGIPFVGPAGRLLQKAVDEIGLDRGDVYVTNAVKHFRFKSSGPGKRRIHQTPELRHLTACRPWLHAEMAVLDPLVMVLLGATAAKQVLGSSARVGALRGQPIPRQAEDRWSVVTIHPSAVLRADDREVAYAGLVSDLRVAANLLPE
jgi:DNA polymerase